MSLAFLNKQRIARWRLGRWPKRMRPGRNLAMVLVALVVGLGEPLLCVVHCQVWLPLLFSQSSMQHMHHHHMPGMKMDGMPGMAMDDTSVAGQPASDAAACHLRGAGGSDVPFHVPPSPVHEVLPAFAFVLLLLTLLLRMLSAPPGTPPRFYPPPPLQPPRPITIA